MPRVSARRKLVAAPSASPPAEQLPQPSFAALLDYLFRTRLHPEGRPLTYLEVALATRGGISYNHIKKLHTGAIKNPTRTTILALCLVFGVRESFFYPDLREHDLDPLEYP